MPLVPTALTPDGSSLSTDWRREIPTTLPWDGVLMCPPDHFAVIDVKNSFMEGQIGCIDTDRARAQWDGLADTYRSLGVTVHVLPAAPGLEDMVFCANPVCVLPRSDGGADVVASHMNHPSRQQEVEHVLRWFVERGCRARELSAEAGPVEGHGDILVVPGRRLALGGYGGRTGHRALAELCTTCNIAIQPLALHGTTFYHLDTCLAVLDEDTVLVHPPAFVEGAMSTLHELFPRVIVAEPAEATEQLAVNVHALADGSVVLPAQAPVTAELLRNAGYRPIPVDVSEFHKSGGSVFCMRADVPTITPSASPAPAPSP
jgi:N-dimethylarginine dimethylaminohydrolase